MDLHEIAQEVDQDHLDSGYELQFLGCSQSYDCVKQYLKEPDYCYSDADSMLEDLGFTRFEQQETPELFEVEQAGLPEIVSPVNSNTGLEGSTNASTLQEIKSSPLLSPRTRSVMSELADVETNVVWDVRGSLYCKTTYKTPRIHQDILEEQLLRLFTQNEVQSAGTVIHPQWNPLIELLLNGAKREGSFLIERSRRDDQVVKKVLTCNKDLIYKVIKNQKVLNGSAWRKRTKDEAFDIIGDELCAGNQQAVTDLFGPDLKHGFKNTTIDWLLGQEGDALLERITSEAHVSGLMETLDEQTEDDIRTNILSKLNNPAESQAFLSKKDKCTKLPCSSLGNKAACLYFYQRLLNRGLDYKIISDEYPAGLRLRRAIALVRSRIALTEVGRRFLQDLGQPNQRGYLQLKKQVPIYFLVLPTETADN